MPTITERLDNLRDAIQCGCTHAELNTDIEALIADYELRLPGIKSAAVTVHIGKEQLQTIVEDAVTRNDEKLRRVLGSDGDDSGLAAL